MDPIVVEERTLRARTGLEPEAIEAIAQGFVALSSGRVTQPPVMRIDLPEHRGEVDVKAAYVPGWDSFAVKLSTGFFDNPARGLPSGGGLMVLLSAETGRPRALLLDNGYLTDLRTALAGAVAADALAVPGAASAGVLGAGSQARWQLRALLAVRPIRAVRVWARRPDAAAAAADALARELKVAVEAVATPEAAVRGSDVVLTTTPSASPLLRAAWLEPGTHVTAMGSDAAHKGELEPAVWSRAEVRVCDHRGQSATIGELRGALAAGTVPGVEVVAELGEVLDGRRPGRGDARQVSVCDLTGTGVQDTVIARWAVARLAQAGDGGHA